MRLSYSEITKLIRDTVQAHDPTAKTILYGSRARGDAREDSDWDVLIIVNRDKATQEDKDISFELWEKGNEIGEEINAFVYTADQWDRTISLFKFNVRDEGILL